MRATVFGLGEAGSLISADLVAAGVDVRGFDPAGVATPPGVRRTATPRDAVVGTDVVIALTAAADAMGALTQALDVMPAATLYADLSTSAAGAKRALDGVAAQAGVDFADVAMMSIVPGNGLRVPALVSGRGADRFVAAMAPLGMPVTSIGGEAGDAATRKLTRSVMMKGLAAVVIESLRAGEAAGCADWLWDNLRDELAGADERFLARLVQGTGQHAVRRLHEMEAARDLLDELGIDALMTRSTIESLRRTPAEGVPAPPPASA
jgi:3-hydroxyisobutyrate dehydrogenase-like beta-hydroxyacid dehydrogenase